MKNHTKVYTEFFHIGDDDKPMCEIPNCCRLVNQIHHINPRGMGGRKQKTTSKT